MSKGLFRLVDLVYNKAEGFSDYIFLINDIYTPIAIDDDGYYFDMEFYGIKFYLKDITNVEWPATDEYLCSWMDGSEAYCIKIVRDKSQKEVLEQLLG
ncbi:MAG: hypothetical protein IKB70_06375 [Bacilli bacterium]|nr:hypothetical protein [Bacilli bacterium]